MLNPKDSQSEQLLALKGLLVLIKIFIAKAIATLRRLFIDLPLRCLASLFGLFKQVIIGLQSLTFGAIAIITIVSFTVLGTGLAKLALVLNASFFHLDVNAIASLAQTAWTQAQTLLAHLSEQVNHITH
ncbi:MAG: hypothetical protein AAGF24_10875 [Cyanobacteria bacterium P01_H01_bin.121]